MRAEYSVLEGLLDAANINSLYRVEQLDEPPGGGGVNPPVYNSMILLGRRQRIAHGGAADGVPR